MNFKVFAEKYLNKPFKLNKAQKRFLDEMSKNPEKTKKRIIRRLTGGAYV